jgi:hypothetical protein
MYSHPDATNEHRAIFLAARIRRARATRFIYFSAAFAGAAVGLFIRLPL